MPLLAQRPDGDPWSPTDVLAHLRACDDLWSANITFLISGTPDRLRTTDPRDYLPTTGYASATFRAHLTTLTRSREQLMDQLEALPDERWLDAVPVPTWGQIYQRHVLYYADRLARHERTHIRQLTRQIRSLTQP